MKRRVLVTGATGFVGQNLCPVLLRAGWVVRATWVHTEPQQNDGIEWSRVDPLGPKTNWSAVLEGVDHVVHLAAVAHRVGALAELSEEEYDIANHLGTYRLAKEVRSNGSIKRLVFISSIGAVTSFMETPVNKDTICLPDTSYGRSKLAGEMEIHQVLDGSETNWCILRPMLVHGPGNPGNMARLFKIVDTSFPLPLSALDSNRRSFVGVSNLIDLILLCLKHPAAANQTFHVSDDDDISTAELLRRIGKALGKPVRNLPIPQAALKAGLHLIGKSEWVDKLFGDLRVDISETKRLLGWKPKMTMEEELERTAKWWRSRQK